MNWFFSLPVTFLALLILLYYLTRKSTTFAGLKSLFPSLFVLFFLSLVISILNMKWVSAMISGMVSAEGLVYVLQLGLLFFILVFSVKFISFFLFDFVFAHKQSIRYPRLIKDIVIILLYVIGLLFIANYYLNIKVTVVLASSAVLTVIFGLALQDILGDLFSGIALNLEDSLKIGDWVKIDEHEGRIEQLQWRSIKLRTIDNVLVVIPNQSASKEAMKSYGHGAGFFALRTRIGVSYTNSPDHVIQVLKDILGAVGSIRHDPPPQVMVTSFDDFAVTYELKYYIEDYSQRHVILSEINRRTWYAFKREGIRIPFPIRDVYLKKDGDPGRISDEEIIRALKSNEVLAAIGEEQLLSLLEEVEVLVYGRGDVLIREGESGRYFYYIISGEVEIRKSGKTFRRLQANDYFGELSLFTGEKTSAEVRVSRECKVLRISSEGFREAVKLNKAMARKLSGVIARRKAGLEEFSEKESRLDHSEIKKDSESIFLRIKKMFSV